MADKYINELTELSGTPGGTLVLPIMDTATKHITVANLMAAGLQLGTADTQAAAGNHNHTGVYAGTALAGTAAAGLAPALSGVSTEYLNGEGNWSTPAGGTAGGVREMLTADRTYYVRTDGNDSNDGLSNSSGGAFLTIQYAIDTAASLDTSIYNITIQIADGTYVSDQIICKNILGAGDVTIQGNSGTPGNVVIDGGLSKSNSGTKYTIKDLKFQKSSSSSTKAITASTGASIDFGNVIFGTGYTQHISCAKYASIACVSNYSITGGATYHVYVSAYGTVQISSMTVTLTGTPAFTIFAVSTGIAYFIANAITWSGSATGSRYTVNVLALINTGSGGADYFPGNSAGSSTGGTYI